MTLQAILLNFNLATVEKIAADEKDSWRVAKMLTILDHTDECLGGEYCAHLVMEDYCAWDGAQAWTDDDRSRADANFWR